MGELLNFGGVTIKTSYTSTKNQEFEDVSPKKKTVLFLTHRIHVWYLYLPFGHVGKYTTAPMDP